MVPGLRESWGSLPRGEVLQGYYDNWLAVHDGAEGWPAAAAGNAAPRL